MTEFIRQGVKRTARCRLIVPFKRTSQLPPSFVAFAKQTPVTRPFPVNWSAGQPFSVVGSRGSQVRVRLGHLLSRSCTCSSEIKGAAAGSEHGGA